MSLETPDAELDGEDAPRRRRVLLVDDEEVARSGLEMALEDLYEVRTAASGEQALEVLEAEAVDVLVSDLRMPGMDGLELLERARALDPDLPVLIITGYAAIDSAVEAMRRGAFDYVSKPFHLDAVRMTLARALEARQLHTENVRLREEARLLRGEDTLIGVSRSMREVVAMVEKVAASRASVLVTGPSGTGKELVARAVHAMSPRRDRPFLGVNCASFPRDLIGSELFGHERGAFTGADTRRPGLFESCEGGTVFLDEIGEIDATTQVSLLRVLQQREVVRVGGRLPVKVDFRLVAATNRKLEEEVEAGRFRTDLYYRIKVVQIELPPLRERPEDIEPLALHFLERVSAREGRNVRELSTRALELLSRYPWPGNVRELENVMERAVILAKGPKVTPSALPEEIARAASEGSLDDLPTLAERELEYIEEVLQRVGGNRTKAARILGVDRSSLWRKLKDAGSPDDD